MKFTQLRPYITFCYLIIGSLRLSAQDCQINDFVAEAFEECNENGYFNLDLDFNIQNGNNAGFDLFVNGIFHSYYPNYPDPFVRIENFAIGNGQTMIISVSDNDNPDCIAYDTIHAPICTVDSCFIGQPQINIICDGPVFYTTIDFEYSGTGTDFIFGGNAGAGFGPFHYTELPITTGPYQADGETSYEFEFIDLDNNQCFNYLEITAPNCEQEDCQINDFVAEAFEECNENGYFNLDLDFNIQNVNNAGFDLFVDGIFHSYYPNYPDPFVRIENFAIGNGQTMIISVSDNDNPDCIAYDTIHAPICMTDSCSINQLVSTTVCDGDQLYISLDFEHSGNGKQFSIHGNGTDYGNFAYNDMPIILGPFTDSEDSTFLEFVATDLNHPNCSNVTEHELANCTTTNTHESFFNKIKCYTNTAHNQLHIEYLEKKSKKMTISIYNLAGQGIYVESSTAPHTIVDISKLTAGMYVCQIVVDGKRWSKKFIRIK